MPRLPATTALAESSRASGLDIRLFVFLILVTLCAGAVRLIGLDHLLVWHDEVFTLIRVFGYQQGEVQSTIFSGRLLTPADLLSFQSLNPEHTWADAFEAFMSHPEHTPLYYVLAHLATGLPVDPVSAARGVSAVSGLLLLAASFWLMRELFGRGPIPWIATALVACSPLQFLYAQEARQYALWMLLQVAASASLVRALRRDTLTDWRIYGVFITLGCYSHLLFILMLPVHAVYTLLSQRITDIRAWRQARRPLLRWLTAACFSLALFSPWLWLIATHQERVNQYTSWMQRPLALWDILLAWAQHLTRIFVDLSPAPATWWSILLLPLGWMLMRFIQRAPRPAAWLLLLTALAYLGMVLAPDLLFGGSRSQHARYALPALLVIQLMAAWVIGDSIHAGAHGSTRRISMLALAVLLTLGGLSLHTIQQSDTWWNKNFSAGNGAVARIANASARTLVAASDRGVTTGELISLAYRLRPEVRIWGEPQHSPEAVPNGFERIIALTPSDKLAHMIDPNSPLQPLAGSWQWLMSKHPTPPSAATPGTAIARTASTRARAQGAPEFEPLPESGASR